MDADKNSGAISFCNLDAGSKIEVIFPGARQKGRKPLLLKNSGDLVANIEDNLGFTQPPNADRTRIGAAMSRVNHHQLPTIRHASLTGEWPGNGNARAGINGLKSSATKLENCALRTRLV